MAKTPEEAAKYRVPRPTEPPATPPPSRGIDPAKARWDELLRLLRSIDDTTKKILIAEQQGLVAIGEEPYQYGPPVTLEGETGNAREHS